MARLSVAAAALLGLAACNSEPSDVPDAMAMQTEQAFEARRAQLRGEPIVVAAAPAPAPAAVEVADAPEPVTPPRAPAEIATRAAAAIDEAETAIERTPLPPAPIAAAAPQAPSGAGLPGLVDGPSGLNIVLAEYAMSSDNRVGERRYRRNPFARLGRGGDEACAAFSSNEEAQLLLLEAEGPERDLHGLDPDGDGFACGWDPEPYRTALRAG